jgi:predicted transcriptional regulator
MSLKDVRNTRMAKMAARGMSQQKIANAMTEMGDPISQRGVGIALALPEVKEIIAREKARLMEMVPSAVTNYDHWIRNAKMFSDKTDKEIAFRATTKILESHGLVSGNVSEQVKITINQNDIQLSPVISNILNSFMKQFSEAKPNERVIDVEFQAVTDDHKALPEDSGGLAGRSTTPDGVGGCQ